MDERLRELEREAIASEDPDTAYRLLIELERLGRFEVFSPMEAHSIFGLEDRILIFGDANKEGSIHVRVSDCILVSSTRFLVNGLLTEFNNISFDLTSNKLKVIDVTFLRVYNEFQQRLKNGQKAIALKKAALKAIQKVLEDHMKEILEAYIAYRRPLICRKINGLRQLVSYHEKALLEKREQLGSAIIDFLKIGGSLDASKPD